MKKLGVIGGLGPFATVDFLNKFYNTYKAKYQPKKDQDFPDISVEFACSTPDRTKFILNQKDSISPRESLKLAIKKLINSNCNIIFCPCNTVYYFLEDAFNDVITELAIQNITLINPIKEVAKHFKQNFYKEVAQKPVLILATDGTVYSNIYKTEFTKQGIESIYPDQNWQKIVMDIIFGYDYGVKLHGNNFQASNQLANIIDFYQNSVSVIALCCSELPICYDAKGSIPVIDPISIACESIVHLLS
jgi:aspartate racemase